MLALVGGLGLGVPISGGADATDSLNAVNLVARELTPSTGNRGAPGTHNTLASYMESKAAFELGEDTCATCTPAENAVLNCCSPGASWDGQCDEGMTHSWLAGYAACNGGGGNAVTVSAASVIREERAALNETIGDLDPEFQRILQEKHAEHKEEKKRESDREEKKRDAHRAASKGKHGKGHAAGAHAARPASPHGGHAAHPHNKAMASRTSRDHPNARTHGAHGQSPKAEHPHNKAMANRASAAAAAAEAAPGQQQQQQQQPQQTETPENASGCSHTQDNPSYNHFSLKDVALEQCEKACLSSTCACYEFHEEDKLCQLSLKKTVEKASLNARAEPRKHSNSGARASNNRDSHRSSGSRSSGSEYHKIAERLQAGRGRVEQTLRGGFERKGHSQRDVAPRHRDDQRSRRPDKNDIKARLGSVKSRLNKWRDDFGTPGREKAKASGREHDHAAEDTGIFRGHRRSGKE